MKNTIRWYLFFSTIIIMFVSAGCLQSANSDDLPELDSRIESSSTPLPTDIPTQTPLSTYTPFPTQDLQVQVVQPTTNTSGIIIATSDPFEVQQTAPDVTLAPGYVEATRIVAQATQQALDMTATAIGPIQQLPTFTPTTDPFAQPTTAFVQPTVPGSDCVHEIKANENLYQLSLRYGVTVYDLARASGIPESDIEFVLIGQKITIPACGTTGAVPPATSTPIPVDTATPVPNVNVTDTSGGFATTAPVFTGRTHLVRQGETLFIIAQQYGVTVDELLAVNPQITDANSILFNREINIP